MGLNGAAREPGVPARSEAGSALVSTAPQSGGYSAMATSGQRVRRQLDTGCQ